MNKLLLLIMELIINIINYLNKNFLILKINLQNQIYLIFSLIQNIHTIFV